LSPFRAGILMIPSFSAFIIGSMVSPVLARRLRPDALMIGGLAVAAIGFLALTRTDATSGLVAVVAGTFIYSLGLAPVFTLTTDLIVGAAPPERAGAASALSETGSELGGALGIAVLGSVGMAVYRGAMAHAIPSDVPADLSHQIRATLGGALAVAEQLPEVAGGELTVAAREAFSRSLDVTSIISAVVVLATAVALAVVLRNMRRPDERGSSRQG
jgi:MFS transporter, DHA2 family, multidrug resistance protein